MIDLDELERLERAATPGPWVVHSRVDWWWVGPEGAESWQSAFDDGGAGGEYSTHCSEPNRDFLVAMRNALPELLRELRAARDVVAGARAWSDAVEAGFASEVRPDIARKEVAKALAAYDEAVKR